VQQSCAEPIDDFAGWLDAFIQPTVLLELRCIVVCSVSPLGWAGRATAPGAGVRRISGSILVRPAADVDGVLFPLVLLCAGALWRAMLL